MFKNKEISQNHYNEISKKYSIFIRKEKYNVISGESNSTNDSHKENDSKDIKSKIAYFLDSLKYKKKSNSKDKDKSYSKDENIRIEKMAFIYLIFQSIRKIEDINYKAIKRVTWKNNQKLYLYIIYCSLVYSLYNKIEYYINKDSKNEKLLKNDDYISCGVQINNINEEIKKKEVEKNKIIDEIKKIESNKKGKIKSILEEIKKIEGNITERINKIKEETRKIAEIKEEKKITKIEEETNNIETKKEKKFKIEVNIKGQNEELKEETRKIKAEKHIEIYIKKIKEDIIIMESNIEKKTNKIKEEIKIIKSDVEGKNKEKIEEIKEIEADLEEKINIIKEDIKIIESDVEEKTSKIKGDIKNLDELKNEQEKIKKIWENKKKITILMEGPFFTNFITNLSLFLKLIEKNYNKKFKDLELKDNNDIILFEYYLLFLGNFDFNENILNIADMWNEFLNPLDDIEIEEKINDLKKIDETITIDFNKEQRTIKIEIMDNEITITKIDNYAIVSLIKNIISLCNNNLEWNLNKYLRPNKFYDNLFVYKTKNIWKNYLYRIFNSFTFNSIKFSFYKFKQIDFLAEKSIFFDIIDNIQFFTFNCIFQGNTIGELFRIYYYGLYNKMYDKSVSLLMYYAFFIINNLHEIGGHLYVRFQYFYSLNEGFESPDIEEKEIDKYGFFGKLRGKESGERLEITFFGRVINNLTINEALYILNIKNYSQKIEDFKNNFGLCNYKNIDELIDNSLEQFLESLGIYKEHLQSQNYIGIYFSNKDFNLNKGTEKGEYFLCSKHPFGLIERPDKKKINGMLDIINEIYFKNEN